jgi:glycosyltransferase involved in cell wall biosynthesis
MTAPAPSTAPATLELSVVIPCLNEADTVATCVAKAVRAMREHGIAGEVILADNGSTDGSRELAAAAGARVVPVTDRGYGAALMGGIAAARGRYILMGDADESYDFLELPKFVAKLREGYDLVQGCRLPSGGGTVAQGAMRFLHRWWGNPMFSAMARRWFGAPIHDVHCGMRAFDARYIRGINLRCTGMEFASEMVIKATLGGARIGEVPITLHKDGRVAHAAHLRTFRDGWRHFRFYLLFSPRWLFLVPGAALILAGLLGYAVAMPRLTIGGITFDVHTLMFASLAIICGYQSILFAVLTKVYGIEAGMLPADPRMTQLFKWINLERGLVAGALTMGGGVALLASALWQWTAAGFGPLDYVDTMRAVIPGVLLTTIGFQSVLSSFFLSILGLRQR